MRESLSRAIGGMNSLGESPAHDTAPVNRIHAVASAQLKRHDEPAGRLARYNLSAIGRNVGAYIDLPVGDPGGESSMWIAVAMIADALQIPSFRLNLLPATAKLVAYHAVREAKNPTCRTCKGRLDTSTGGTAIPDVDRIKGWREGDGPVPMKPCPACSGTGKHRYGDDERERLIGDYHKNMAKAFSEAHSLISRAIDTLNRRTWELERDR